MEQTEGDAVDISHSPPLPKVDGGADTSDESDAEMPPLEDMKRELSGPAHGKNIKGVAAEGDNASSDEDTTEDPDGWIDILNNGELRKKVLKPGTTTDRPPRGSKVTIRIVTRLYNEQVGLDGDPASGPIIEQETYDRFALVIGDNDLHQGLDLLLPLMDRGETARMLIKPRFAYGLLGNKSAGIPADATLELEVELLDILKYSESPYGSSPLGASPDPEPGEPNPVVVEENLVDRLKLGNYKKGRGNFWFERGEYSLAIQCYRGAIRYLDASEAELSLLDRFKVDKLEDKTDEVTLEQVHQIEDLIDKRAQSYNNLAATQLKLQAYDQALRSVEDSLLLRPENVKALYRRAKIRAERGDLEAAIEDLNSAAAIDPNSEAIAQERDRLNKVLARQLKEQRQMYRRMMNNVNNANDDRSPPDGKERTDTTGKGDGAQSPRRTATQDAGRPDQKRSSSSSKWFSLANTGTMLSAGGALAAALLLPSLYLYLK